MLHYHIIYVHKTYVILWHIRLFLLTTHPNLLSYKALPGNTIYEMKVCLNIDGVFKLIEIVFLVNFYYIYSQK